MYCVALALAAFAASFLMVTCVHISKENEVLKTYVEFYRGQSQSAIDGWKSCGDDLMDAAHKYKELAEKYHELCGYYERAYKVLEEYELLEEVNADGDDDNDCDV